MHFSIFGTSPLNSPYFHSAAPDHPRTKLSSIHAQFMMAQSRRWPDTPHPHRDCSHTFPPSRSICSFLDLQPDFFHTLLHLLPPCQPSNGKYSNNKARCLPASFKLARGKFKTLRLQINKNISGKLL